MDSRLYTQLKAYTGNGPYPLHMPGHKRRLCPVPELPYSWDMTEVRGVDDLHDADGILREAMERTARLHGAARTWYLVNGSTCGLLAGIRALAPTGSKIIAARNCHKSVYHAVELGSLSVRWLTPPMLEKAGVYGSIPPLAVEEALRKTPEAACVVLTSPTYEGVISDIAGIAEVCHRFGVPLLVDEAHGAHLGLAEGWPKSALRLGADLVVESAHKTLPSLTQTALLHLGEGSLADPDEVERQLGVFETSSPSYPLMASLDGCTGLLMAEGERLFAQWKSRLERFDCAIEGLSQLRVLGHGWSEEQIFAFDPGKLPVCTAGTTLTGPALADVLLEKYGFETEMSQGDICLAMTGLGDDEDALDRCAEALLEIDRGVKPSFRPAAATLPAPGEEVCTMAEAILRPRVEAPLREAIGRVSGEYVWAYPPGVPLTAPGERLTEEFFAVAEMLKANGTELHHSNSKKRGHILVLA